jgi:hypothetical protein
MRTEGASGAVSEIPALLRTLRELLKTLDALDAPYMLIGGVALGAWTTPRATADIDLVIGVPAEDLATFGTLLGRKLGGVTSARPLRFRNGMTVQRVVVTRPEGDLIVDLLLCAGPFLEEALERRVRAPLPDVAPIHVATPEDLILMKLVAGRPQDLVDVRSLIAAQRVDRAYIRRWAARLKILTRLRRVGLVTR